MLTNYSSRVSYLQSHFRVAMTWPLKWWRNCLNWVLIRTESNWLNQKAQVKWISRYSPNRSLRLVKTKSQASLSKQTKKILRYQLLWVQKQLHNKIWSIVWLHQRNWLKKLPNKFKKQKLVKEICPLKHFLWANFWNNNLIGQGQHLLKDLINNFKRLRWCKIRRLYLSQKP